MGNVSAKHNSQHQLTLQQATSSSSNNKVVTSSFPPISDQMNEALCQIPELAKSELYLFEYPLTGTKWLVPTAKMNGVHSAYVASTYTSPKKKSKAAHKPPLRRNYVHGKGIYGMGYYHLMTHDAWKILDRRYSKRNKQPEHRNRNKILRQRASSKFRNDSNPNNVHFYVHPKVSVKSSRDAKRAGYALGSIGILAGGAF